MAAKRTAGVESTMTTTDVESWNVVRCRFSEKRANPLIFFLEYKNSWRGTSEYCNMYS
jgi:hypothetical protein